MLQASETFVTPTAVPMVKVLTVVPTEPAEVHPLQVAPNVAGDAAAVPSSIQMVPAGAAVL